MLNILIADDEATCRVLLERMLKGWGYNVIVCSDGLSAWQRISAGDIDIAILDWYMPEMTGPQITEKHAALDEAPFVYKIILSGKMEKHNVIEALHCGAHDVMEKPCDTQLLKRRLATASNIIREKRAVEQMAQVMERYANQMETLANQRAQQLVQAERMSSLGVLAAGVAHEINNPMSFISGNVQNLQRFWKDLEPILKSHTTEDSKDSAKIGFILEEMPKIFDSIMKGVVRVTAIVKSLKKYSGSQNLTERQALDINTCIQQALEICQGSVGKQTKLQLNLDTKIHEIQANFVEIEQVLINLMVNSCHAMEDKNQQILTISTKNIIDQQNKAAIQIVVEDTGTGIPENLLNKIWDPFFTTKAQGKGTGLGLSISNGIIKNHGGCISVKNKPEGGAYFEITIPAISKPSEANK